MQNSSGFRRTTPLFACSARVKPCANRSPAPVAAALNTVAWTALAAPAEEREGRDSRQRPKSVTPQRRPMGRRPRASAGKDGGARHNAEGRLVVIGEVAKSATERPTMFSWFLRRK